MISITLTWRRIRLWHDVIEVGDSFRQSTRRPRAAGNSAENRDERRWPLPGQRLEVRMQHLCIRTRQRVLLLSDQYLVVTVDAETIVARQMQRELKASLAAERDVDVAVLSYPYEKSRQPLTHRTGSMCEWLSELNLLFFQLLRWAKCL